MKGISKIFELGYLIIAIVFLVETVLKWNEDRMSAYLTLFFSVLAICMYFFRKRFRKKIDNSK
ncbi:hypothetical protein ACFQ5N_06455 [Lutibacter holmesii]|uniref:LPXTG cell wall anchor domain-containing protein n=1 Tax=Lutibacter holmesii TaxID=1137985 RepID=A0ABW3WNH3_9FLAO